MPNDTYRISDENLQGFIAEQVKAGKFENEDDAVTDAVRRVSLYAQKRDELREMLDEGIEQLDRGEGIRKTVKQSIEEHRRKKQNG